MKQIIWSKTLLTAYRYFERIADAIDNLVMKEALGSLASCSSLLSLKSADKISSKIIDLTEKKVSIINAKIAVEKTLYSMKEEQSQLLIKKYLEGKKTNDCVEECSYARRTYYRRIDAALKSFAHNLKMFGFDEQRLQNMLGDQKWIMKIYDTFYLEEMRELNEFCFDAICENNIFLQNICRGNKLSLFC